MQRAWWLQGPCAEKRCFQRALPGWVRVLSLWGSAAVSLPWSWMCRAQGEAVPGLHRGRHYQTLGPQRRGWAGSWGLQGLGPWACGQSARSAPRALGTAARGIFLRG